MRYIVAVFTFFIWMQDAYSSFEGDELLSHTVTKGYGFVGEDYKEIEHHNYLIHNPSRIDRYKAQYGFSPMVFEEALPLEKDVTLIEIGINGSKIFKNSAEVSFNSIFELQKEAFYCTPVSFEDSLDEAFDDPFQGEMLTELMKAFTVKDEVSPQEEDCRFKDRESSVSPARILTANLADCIGIAVWEEESRIAALHHFYPADHRENPFPLKGYMTALKKYVTNPSSCKVYLVSSYWTDDLKIVTSCLQESGFNITGVSIPDRVRVYETYQTRTYLHKREILTGDSLKGIKHRPIASLTFDTSQGKIHVQHGLSTDSVTQTS